jgi:hypothetical protein
VLVLAGAEQRFAVVAAEEEGEPLQVAAQFVQAVAGVLSSRSQEVVITLSD